MDEDEKLYVLIGFIILGVRITVILFGVVGNTLSLITWTRPHLKSPSSAIFITLAGCDTLIILCGIIWIIPLDYMALLDYKGVQTLNPTLENFLFNYYTLWSVLEARTIYVMAVNASMYLTLLIMFQRYIGICHPFMYDEWCSYKKTCKVVAAIILFLVVYDISMIWEWQLVEHSGSKAEENFTWYEIQLTELPDNPIYHDLKKVGMLTLIGYLLPLGFIIALIIITRIQLKTMSANRRTMADTWKDDDKLTTMMLYVALEFLVFNSFSGFTAALNVFPNNLDRYIDSKPGLRDFLAQVGFLLDSLNSSVNIVTYVLCYPRFRETFMNMFCRHKKVDESIPVSSRNPEREPDTRTTPV